MDDDLMSLRSGSGSRSSSDDDLFGGFTDPNDLGFDFDSPAAESATADEFDFGDPFDLPSFDEPAPSPAPTQAPPTPVRSTPAPAPAKPQRSARKPKRRSSRGFLGMTAQQRMVLAVFLFLDVAVLGLLILIALGAVNLGI